MIYPQGSRTHLQILLVGVPQVPLRVRHFYSFEIRTELQPSPVITPFDVPSPVQNSHKARITGWKRITDIAERPSRIWSRCFATHGQCDGSGWWKAMEPWHNFWHLYSGASWELRSIGLMQSPLLYCPARRWCSIRATLHPEVTSVHRGTWKPRPTLSRYTTKMALTMPIPFHEA